MVDGGIAGGLARWEAVGLVATGVIALSFPLYVLKTNLSGAAAGPEDDEPRATFVGRERCVDCHRIEHDKWTGSHHDLAMDVADDGSVLGDFDDAVFEHRGVSTRFFKKGENFYVHTEGPDGKMADFQVTHTFGADPLQQYLVPFPGGRLQCLSIAWDNVKKRWYHLYPEQDIAPGDWLHWTGQAQNWNGMCAECHSTHLTKGYDQKTDTYRTTYFEIDVSCEACHGPCSEHVAWAEMPEMARPEIENFGLVVRTRDLSSAQQVELCARCHARRSLTGDYRHPQKDVLDAMIPELLTEALYYADGQIQEEVYVYASFLQSKMYQRDVTCSDCHDVHSLKRLEKGNALCLQCHRGEVYDSKAHHFHKKADEPGDPIVLANGETIAVGEGARCEECHMPDRVYMGIDARRDHSIRIPRPDLSAVNQTPNPCNGCHADKDIPWSVKSMKEWYGQSKKPHYGSALAAARLRKPNTIDILIRLFDDVLLPVVVRATAVSMMISYPGKESVAALERALEDEQSMIRHAAIHTLNRIGLGDEGRLRLAVPLLYDPVRAVRMEAALCLSRVSDKLTRQNERELYKTALAEYKESMAYLGDFAEAQFNQGLLASNLDDTALEEEHYRRAIEIDGDFYPALVNLAMLQNEKGNKALAEELLRRARAVRPDLPELAYSLGLLLAERNKGAEALQHMTAAAAALPGRSRVHYNTGLLFQQLDRPAEAEGHLLRALELEPENLDYLHALTVHYITRGMKNEAEAFARKMEAVSPRSALRSGLLTAIERMGR